MAISASMIQLCILDILSFVCVVGMVLWADQTAGPDICEGEAEDVCPSDPHNPQYPSCVTYQGASHL